MPRWLYSGLLLLFGSIAAIAVAALAVGELLSGAVPTAVNTLAIDLPLEPVQIPLSKNRNTANPANTMNTDGEEGGPAVQGWLVRGEPGRGMVLLVHSLRSNRVEMLSRAQFLHEQGYGSLLIDLRAHGETPGDRITFGAREAQDVEAAVDFLRDAFPGERIGAIGVSLGAAAIVLAGKPLRLDAVVLESLHPTIEEAVDNRLRLHLGEYGTIFSPLLLWQLSFRLNLTRDELSPINRIGDLYAPLLLVSGTDDRHTTVAETERMFDAARQPKEIWIVPGGGHFNMHTYAGKEYEERILDFLGWYLRPRERSPSG